MKKDDWIKIFVPLIVGLLTGGGVVRYIVIDIAYFVAIPIILFIVLFVCIRYFSEPERTDRIVEMLRDFINPLISNLEADIRGIDNSLHNGRFTHPKSPIEPNYKYAHTDILGNKNYEWIKKKVDEYNELNETINDAVTELEHAIRDAIEHRYPKEIIKNKKDMRFLIFSIANNDKAPVSNPEGIYGFWNENRNELLALRDDEKPREYINQIKTTLTKKREIATELKDKLEELKEQHMKRSDIAEDKIERKKEVIGSGAC